MYSSSYLKNRLRFYFITDDHAPDLSPMRQVEIAIKAGATFIQYRNKSFSLKDFDEAAAIWNLCKTHQVLFVVNDDIILAKAVGADGVHLGQEDAELKLARQILGPNAIIGASVSTLDELSRTDLSLCDYIGAGPVFPTGTKTDAKAVIGLAGLKKIVDQSPVPIVAIGGIDEANITGCFSQGVAGVSMISAITRADHPEQKAAEIATACGCSPRALVFPWQDEFKLIDKILGSSDRGGSFDKIVKVPPGDDAALLESIKHPVITTDTQKENIHFRLDWQTLDEVGEKAVEITFSDLAASYAIPMALFVNLSIPSHMTDDMIEALYKGINAALNQHGAVLAGGNISAGPDFSIDLFAVGEGNPDLFPLRSTATPGDGLYVTGPIGMARAGLDCLMNNEAQFPALIKKFIAPAARFDAARRLATHGVKCVMDISDGLAGDAKHIADASRISIEFDPAGFQIDPALLAYCGKYGLDPLVLMLSGGEDYELLFACKLEIFEQLRKHLPEAFCVGRCLSYTGEPIINLPEGVFSFQHGEKK